MLNLLIYDDYNINTNLDMHAKTMVDINLQMFREEFALPHGPEDMLAIER